MDISHLKAGERGEIINVSCDAPLAARLSSLGIKPKEEIKVLKVSLLKETFLIRTGASLIAMRKEAAQCVQIKKL